MMPGIYAQKGPRAHHFVGGVSFFVGLSIFFEYYVTNSVFSSLDGVFGMTGQHVWGLIFIFLGLLVFQRRSIILRASTEIVLCFVWTIFGLYSLYISLFDPQLAGHTGSVFGILAIAMATVCLLASSNLRRDFYVTKKQWFKDNPLEKIIDPLRPKGGDSNRG